MPKTKLTDVIVPEVFSPYAIERTTELSEIIQSGAVQRLPAYDALCNGGGKVIDIPYWKEITGDSEVLNDSADLSPDKISASSDQAALHPRAKAWGAHVLVGWMAGDDPMARIADMVAGYWARDLQRMFIASLNGVFDGTAGVLKDTHRVNIYSDVVAGSITDAMRFLATGSFIDATLKLGDHSTNIVAVCMHSDVEGLLRKREMVQDTQPSTGVGPRIPTLQGRRVIVDDNCPKVAGTNSPAYTTYLFARGAFGNGYRTDDPEDATEVQRMALAGDTYLVTRRRLILHPLGVKWIGNPAGAGPTNAELATPANWQKVYADKNIGIIAVRHNV